MWCSVKAMRRTLNLITTAKTSFTTSNRNPLSTALMTKSKQVLHHRLSSRKQLPLPNKLKLRMRKILTPKISSAASRITHLSNVERTKPSARKVIHKMFKKILGLINQLMKTKMIT